MTFIHRKHRPSETDQPRPTGGYGPETCDETIEAEKAGAGAIVGTMEEAKGN